MLRLRNLHELRTAISQTGFSCNYFLQILKTSTKLHYSHQNVATSLNVIYTLSSSPGRMQQQDEWRAFELIALSINKLRLSKANANVYMISLTLFEADPDPN